MAQRVGGCLTVLEDETEHQGQDELALLVAPAATLGVGELLLLVRAVNHLLLVCTTLLTCRGSGCGLVGVVVLLASGLTRSLPMSTMLSLLGSEASVVLVPLHQQSESCDSLCLNASMWADDERGGGNR
jgi:hypothetical protein